MDKAKIDFAEINKYGAVVVYGSEGIKHYYGYTISEAKHYPKLNYLALCAKKRRVRIKNIKRLYKLGKKLR